MKKAILIVLLVLVCLPIFAETTQKQQQFIDEAHTQGFEVFYFKEDEYAKSQGIGIVYTSKGGKVSVLNKDYLNYKKYVGKLCYFKDPIEGEYGMKFLPVVIETGETVYVQFYAGCYGNSPSFIYGGVESYDKLIEAQNLIASKYYLFDGYDVYVADVQTYSWGEEWTLSDGNTIWKSSYDFLTKLVNQLSFENEEQRKVFIKNALDSQISILYDDFDEETQMIVSATDDIELNAYVSNKGNLTNSFVLFTYAGSSWKFIDNIRMKSDSLEYSVSQSSNRSVMSSGNVFEAITIFLNSDSKLFSFLKSAGENNSLKIRMSGSKGSVDLAVDEKQLHRIVAFLGVIEFLETH